MKHDGGTILLYRYFSAAGPKTHVRVEGKLNTAKYWLNHGRNPYAVCKKTEPREEFCFLQDNDSKDKAKTTQDWLKIILMSLGR